MAVIGCLARFWGWFGDLLLGRTPVVAQRADIDLSTVRVPMILRPVVEIQTCPDCDDPMTPARDLPDGYMACLQCETIVRPDQPDPQAS